MSSKPSKDPAVLWYYRDYLSGTEDMPWAEQGAYARLLNKQADKGHLSIDAIRKILKKDFEKLWPGISEKFIVDADGNFYNERMDLEVEKRRRNSQTQKDRINAYWESRRNNDGNTTESSTESSTDIPIANANANSKNVENGQPPKNEPVGIERVRSVAREVWENQAWTETICMGHGLTLDALKKWMAQYNGSICNDVIHGFDKSKYQKMFGGWLNTQKGKGYNLNNSLPNGSSAPPLKQV